MLRKGYILFNGKDELDGTLVIRKHYAAKPNSELYAIKEMVLSGKGDYRFSSPLQALLWGYMDGKFKEGDDPLKSYRGPVDFVRPIWGDMKGNRWETFDAVAARVNTPRLLNLYINTVIDYDEPRVGYTKPAQITFKDGYGDCSDVVELGRVFLSKAGYDVRKRCAPKHVMGYIKKDGLYWVVIDFQNKGLKGENYFRGPSKKLDQLIKSPYIECGPGVNP